MKKIISLFSLLVLCGAHAQYTPVNDLYYTTNAANEIVITGFDSNILDLNIPPSINGLPVVELRDEFAFYSIITNCVLPDSIKKINAAAFSHSSLVSINFPPSLEFIGPHAFYRNPELLIPPIPASVSYIGVRAFPYTNTEQLSVEAGNMHYKTIDGVLYSFDETTLHTYPCKKTDTFFSVPDSVHTIQTNAFSSVENLAEITLPNSITNIQVRAFEDLMNLVHINLPTTLERIEEYSFFFCNSLASLTLPASLHTIDQSAFHSCTSLTSLTFLGNAPTIGSSVFYDVPGTVYVYPDATGFGASFGGLPVVVLNTSIPLDSITVENGNLVIKPTDGITGITVEQTDDLIDGTWTAITPTLLDDCILLPTTSAKGYYRLSNE